MDIVEEMRGFECDHEPDGWPAIQMKQVSALCDEIERLRAQLKAAQEQEPVAYGIPNSAITGKSHPMMTLHHERCGQYPELMVPLYAAPVPAMPIPKQEPAVAVHELKDIEVTDQMASAFNQAICDDAMNDQDIEEVKTGLRAAISHLHPMPKSFYELEIDRLVAINDSLLANERRLIERLRTMQSSPRITEQDAREIFNSILENQELDFDYWINNCDGRTILNKLNANAVAEAKVNAASNHELADAIMEFSGNFIGAYLNGFIDTPFTNIAQIYQVARNHVKDSYGIETKTLIELIGKEDFDRCYAPVPAQAAAMPEYLSAIEVLRENIRNPDRGVEYCGIFDNDKTRAAIGTLLSAAPKPE